MPLKKEASSDLLGQAVVILCSGWVLRRLWKTKAGCAKIPV
jgi:hypothetical protein